MGSKTFDGVWFISYSHVRRSRRWDSVEPVDAKRSDIRRIFNVAAAHAAELMQLWRRLTDRHPNDLTTDEEIDAAIEQARQFEDEPRIVSAVFRPEPELDLLMLRLSDGRRLPIPREELSELKQATPEQAADFQVGATEGISGGRSWTTASISQTSSNPLGQTAPPRRRIERADCSVPIVADVGFTAP